MKRYRAEPNGVTTTHRPRNALAGGPAAPYGAASLPGDPQWCWSAASLHSRHWPPALQTIPYRRLSGKVTEHAQWCNDYTPAP